MRELEQIDHLCTYNKDLQSDVQTAPFIRFPVLVLTNVAFGERHDCPLLESLQEDLQSVALGASRVNQLIGLRDSMWAMEKNQGQDYRHLVRNEICGICAGTKKHQGSNMKFPDSVERALNGVREIAGGRKAGQ